MTISTSTFQSIINHTSIEPQDRWYTVALKSVSSLPLKVSAAAFAALETLTRIFCAPILIPVQGWADWSAKTTAAAMTIASAIKSVPTIYTKTSETPAPDDQNVLSDLIREKGKALLILADRNRIATTIIVGSIVLGTLCYLYANYSTPGDNANSPFVPVPPNQQNRSRALETDFNVWPFLVGFGCVLLGKSYTYWQTSDRELLPCGKVNKVAKKSNTIQKKNREEPFKYVLRTLQKHLSNDYDIEHYVQKQLSNTDEEGRKCVYTTLVDTTLPEIYKSCAKDITSDEGQLYDKAMKRLRNAVETEQFDIFSLKR